MFSASCAIFLIINTFDSLPIVHPCRWLSEKDYADFGANVRMDCRETLERNNASWDIWEKSLASKNSFIS